MPTPIETILAGELGAKQNQVEAAIKLLDEGATVPFISRYRKEVTGGLTDEQLRMLEERLRYLRELAERRESIIKSIEEQGKMTPALRTQIENATDKTSLEDLYTPYKQKRRTKATIAIEAGLEPLADALLKNPRLSPLAEAKKYLRAAFKSEGGENPGVASEEAALEGARFILIQRFGEDASLIGELRRHAQKKGLVTANVKAGKEEEGAKFKDYFAYSENWSKIPSHRALALLRGQEEGVLQISLHPDGAVPEGRTAPMGVSENTIADFFNIRDMGRAADEWLEGTVRLAWRGKILPSLETEQMTTLRERAEDEAIKVFARNLRELLLAAPAGHKVTLGLDPGLRTGVKVAVVDNTGKVLDHSTVYPHTSTSGWSDSLKTLAKLVTKHSITLISIGNGTASRETEKLAKELVKLVSKEGASLTTAIVSEAGASVYSASEYAQKELPTLDVTIRGAVSIARRLQDPMAELVKIDPKSIGVGQYQHDVNQSHLARSLDATVEDVVNAVGVDVNTASAKLLERVSGLNSTIANNIVSHRNENGAFKSRAALKKVPRLGDKAFEQAAGFLRIPNAKNALDASGVHPESYDIAEKILDDLGLNAKTAIGSPLLKTIDPKRYVTSEHGLPTILDIIKELEKPGRDPRGEFKTAVFMEGVEDIKDLKVGMQLEGTITNVAAFGAFVDIGVHQDGLVHISELSNNFVRDPHTVAKVGQVVQVRVLEVDAKRKRIGLSMKK